MRGNLIRQKILTEGVSGFSKLVVKDWFLSHSDIQGGEQLSLSVVLKGPAEAEP